MTSRSYRVGIVGTGIMGRRMLAALTAHPRFEVVQLWDPDADALRVALARAPGARAASSLEALATDPAIDCVYVASPPSMHLAAVRATLSAGRACLCEKPLAATIDEAETLATLVHASGQPFAVHFPFASATGSRRLIEIVRGGELGPVESATIKLRFAVWPRAWQAGASGWLAGPTEGGFTREVLSHFVFLALRLFGPASVDAVEVDREPGRSETALRARLVHANAVVLIDAAVAGEAADHNRFELVGRSATVALVDWSYLEWAGQVGERVDALPATLDRLASMLEGRPDHELATVDEATAVVRCIEALLRD